MTAGLRPRQLLGALCSGIALVLVFPRWDLRWLAWVSLVPLLLVIRTATAGEAFLLGFASGVIAYGGLMEWIRIFGIPAWILLSVGMAGFLGAFAAGAVALVRRYGGDGENGVWLWVVPLTWAAVEYARSVGPLGFPWGLLGLTQSRTPAVLALAPLVGVTGISAVIALVNVAIADVVAAPRRWRPAAITALAVLAMLGGARLLPRPVAAGSRIVAAIQPNIPPQAKGVSSTSVEIIEGLLRQTKEARIGGADIIVYPETAVPPGLSAVADVRRAIAHTADNVVVVAGAFLPGPQNGVLVIGAGGETVGRYAKRRLVPFGEAGVRPGLEADPVVTASGTIGLAICYESAFSDLVRPLVVKGADLLAVLTNDGWFGTSAGPAQHAAHAVLRAAETGRSVVRAANTGTSMLIRPDGVIAASQPLGTAGVLAAALPIGGPLTFYVRWGWLFAPLALVGWLVAATPLAMQAARRHPAAFTSLGVAIAAPAAVFLAAHMLDGSAGGPGGAASLVVLALCAVLARGRLLNRRGVWVSAGVSMALTALLVVAMRAAYARYGFAIPLGPADGRWGPWLAPHLLRGLAVEAWLRGAVFAEALTVGGWPLALVLSSLLGVVLHLGQAQEIIFWQLFTGVGFAAIRLWTKDAVGLGPARGLGDAAIQALTNLR